MIPFETHNLLYRPEHAATLAALRAGREAERSARLQALPWPRAG